MSTIEIVFSINLLLLSLDHLYSGSLALFFPKKAIRVYKKLFGADIPETVEYFAILKPWGALGVFAGIVGLLPVYDAKRYIGVLFALVVLLICRIIYRFAFQADSEKYIKLSKKRNAFHIMLIVICVVVMLLQLITIFDIAN